jgi:hypothetical protein
VLLDGGTEEGSDTGITTACTDGSYPTEQAVQAGAGCSATGAAAFTNGVDYSTIMDALRAAGPDDTVHICPGVHSELLRVIGEDAVFEGTTDDASDTVLDGGGVNRLMTIDDATVRLINLTLQNGYDEYAGGAIEASDAVVEVLCTAFIDNIADYEGGAIVAGGRSQHSLVIIDSLFEGNWTGGSGGAVQFGGWDDGPLLVAGSTFTDNIALYEGGAFSIGSWAHDDIEIVDTTFKGNSADNGGGALALGSWGSSALLVSNSSFEDNVSNLGGAISLDGWSELTTAVLSSTFFHNNTASVRCSVLDVGSGVEEASIEFDRSTVVANTGGAAVCANVTTTTTSIKTDWGSVPWDNDTDDLSSPCGLFSNLGRDESFTCLPDGTWK